MTEPRTPYVASTPNEYPAAGGIDIHVDDMLAAVRSRDGGDLYHAHSGAFGVTAFICPDDLPADFTLPEGFTAGGTYLLATGPLSEASARVFARALVKDIRDAEAEGLCDSDGGRSRAWAAFRKHTWIPLELHP